MAALRATRHSSAPAEALAAVSAPADAPVTVNATLHIPAGHYAVVDCRHGFDIEAAGRCAIVVFGAEDYAETAPAPVPSSLTAAREELFQALTDLSGNAAATEAASRVLTLYLDIFAAGGALDTVESQAPEADLAARAEAIMRRSISRRMSLADLAASLGCSRPHLSATFKKVTGQSPIDHFNRMKIEHAAVLLRTTGMKIAEVSSAVGIADPFYFSRLFKKLTGHTPQSLR